MSNILVVSIFGGLGSMAFALLYHIKARHLFFAGLGGMLTTFVCLSVMELLDGHHIAANLIAAFVGGVYSAICAYCRKAPSVLFLIPSLFVLVPGRSLYYSMMSFMHHNMDVFVSNIVTVVEISLGIAMGVMLSSMVGDVFFRRRSRL